MIVDFALMFSNLESMGFYTFVLPWVLFLVIIYSIVTKAPFLKDIGNQSKQISVIIAAILSFYIVNYEWNGQFVGDYLTEMFGTTSLYIAGFLVLILFLGMGGFSLNSIFGGKWIPAVMVLLAIMIFFNTGAAAQFNVDDETMTWIFMLLLVGGALWFLNSEPAKKKDEGSGVPTQSNQDAQKQAQAQKAQQEAAAKATAEAKKAQEQPAQPELTPEQKKAHDELVKKVDALANKNPEFKKELGAIKTIDDQNKLLAKWKDKL